MKTIQELADELGVSYTALRKQLQREPLCSWIVPFQKVDKRKKFITEAGEMIIRQYYSGKRDKDQEMEKLLMEKEGQVKELMEMIRQELSQKDIRIHQLEQELVIEREKNSKLEEILQRMAGLEQAVSMQQVLTTEKDDGLFPWQKRK